MSNMVLDRIKGALIGVAVGDAMGGPLEFMSKAAIRAKHGKVTEMIGGGWLDLEPGEVTDDTQMTMCVARGIAENPEDPVPGIGRRFVEWGKSGPKDIGGTCASAIHEAMLTKPETETDWLGIGFKIAGINRMNAGNGALMRTIYPAVYYGDPETRKRMVLSIGRMTHYNEMSDEICVQYADAVHAAIFGGHPSYYNFTQYRKGADPTGYVLDSWSNALDAVTYTDTFEDAIIEAVNRGGDADTIGAIAGGLAGAYYGVSKIPARWIKELDPALLSEIDALAELAYKAMKEYYNQRHNPSQEGSVNRLWISEEPVHKENKGRRFLSVLIISFLFFILTSFIIANIKLSMIDLPQHETRTETAPPKSTVVIKEDVVTEKPEEKPQIRYQLTDEERSIVERVVMTEAGDQSLLGQMAVAQCILNTAEATGQRPDAVVTAPKQYARPADADKVSADVKYSVSLVFDKGDFVTEEPIRFFYAPKYSSGSWHESALEYVDTFDDHRFFKVKD